MLSSSTGTWVHVVTSVCVFVAWTVTSFLCHECGKRFLRQSTDNSETTSDGGAIPRLAWALLLTVTQCVTCLLLVRTESNDKEGGRSRTVLALIVTHVLATLCTNYSMAYIEAASTFAIKLTEPVTMAIGHHIVFMLPVPFQTVVSIPLIVFGVLLFSGPTAQSFTGSAGIVLAFASNVILTARNIALKKLQPEGTQSVKTLSLRSSWCIVMTLLCELGALMLMLGLVESGSLTKTSWWLTAFALMSGLFHVAYSYISTSVVLKVMNVVSHSIANIFKRIFVVLLLYASGKRYASGVNFLGLIIAGVGFFIYIRGKTRAGQTDTADKKSWSFDQFKRNIILALGVLLISSMAIIVTTTRGYSGVAHMRQRASGFVSDTRNRALLAFNMSLDTTDVNSDIFSESEIDPVMEDFLTWRLVDHPEETDMRAKTLTTNRAVVEEAQRILMNLLQDLLGKVRHVMLLEIATYENKGDPAIATGEVMLLRKMNISIVFYCSTTACRNQTTIDHAYTVSKNYAMDDLVILMQGGGNLVGYSMFDGIRQSIIKRFTDRKIILFSQSILVNKGNAGHLKTCQRIYSNRPNLVIFLRDRQSLEIAKKNFLGTKLILAPDLAFCIGMTPRQIPPSYDIVWLKRNDYESSKYKLPTFPSDISVHVSDWISQWKSNKGTTDMETVFLIATAGFQFLQRGRIVVTDRLHGHILSTLMNIPHVLIDNPPNLKLSTFDQSWTAGLSNTILISNGSLALDAARLLLKRFNSSLPAIGPKDMNARHS